MADHSNILDAQVQSMMEYLRRYEVEQISALLDASHRTATEIRRSAYRRARERMHKRFQRERRRMRDAEQLAAARVATKLRLAKHSHANELIEAAWALLPATLDKRWKDREARSEWCDMLLELALSSLPGPEILVEHPEDWDVKERRAFLGRIGEHYGRSPKARADPGLEAGLRIHSNCACLDGSTAGLLAQRRRVEAEFLSLLTQTSGDISVAAEASHG